MRLVSWNVNGIRAVMKKEFMASFENFETDVLCLQETKAQESESSVRRSHNVHRREFQSLHSLHETESPHRKAPKDQTIA